jgi:hypothetical protein
LPEKVNQVLAIYNVTDVENLVISPTIHWPIMDFAL